MLYRCVILTYVFLFVVSTPSKGQELSGKERAYLYHAAFNSPKIEHHLKYFFHYEKDSLPMINDTLPNFDSIAYYIIEHPNKMQWEPRFMKGQENGLLLELSHKLAMRNLNQVVAYNTNMPKAKKEKFELENPENYLTLLKENLPPSVVNNGTINNDVKQVLASNYTNSDRITRLRNTAIPETTVKNIVTAINKTNAQWINQETIRIFNILGGQIDTQKIQSFLMAAGDGAGSIDKNNGYEAQIHTPIAQSIYQIINHFGYGLKLGKPGRNSDVPIYTNLTKTENSKTYGKNISTNIHFTVWGYTEIAQTTVVVFKNQKAYPLFGQKHHPFLSTDSSYNGERTYYSIINELEHVMIADLKEMLYGKRGFEYQINKNKDYAEDLRMKIKKTEVKLNAMRYGGVPTSKGGKKKKKTTQEYYVWLNSELEATLAEIKRLELAWEEAQEKLSYFEAELDKMKRTIGYTWMTYEIEDSIATFSDGSTFNLKTQDFTFPGTDIPEDYEIRLIAIPEEPLMRPSDEVFVAAIQYPSEPQNYIIFDQAYIDQFEKNYPLLTQTFTEKDSAIVEQIMVDIYRMKKYPDVRIVGHGAISRQAQSADYIQNYPGDTKEAQKEARNSDAFSKQRKVTLTYNINTHKINVDGYTDPVIYNGYTPESWAKDTAAKEPQFKNELFSAAKAMATFDDWSRSLLEIGKDHVSAEVYDDVEKKISKMRKKARARFSYGEEMKLKDYEKEWK